VAVLAADLPARSTAISKSLPDGAGWLMFHSVGKFPGQADAIKRALADFADQWCAEDDRRWAALDAGRQAAIRLWSALVGAPEGSVMAAENVTACFHTFVEALPSEMLAGRSVLIAEDCFPSLHFLLTELASRRGFDLVTVRRRRGAAWVEDADFIAAWDARVALAVITWVTSTASKRADLEMLVEHGSRMGSLIAVDLTQSLGCVPFDVGSPAVDFAASTCLKWLCGVPGAGLGYVAPDLLPQLQPGLRGWFSQPDPFNWDIDRFSLAADARRFDHGTPSYLPFIASVPGLQWHARTGTEAIRAHNLRLSHALMDIADRHSLALASPREDEKRGGTVVVESPEGIEAADLQRHLMARGIFCDTRGNRVRWSPGLVTSDEALAVLDAALGELTGRRRTARAGAG
jgi:selenocysteine lyase/cysteine desulfurase